MTRAESRRARKARRLRSLSFGAVLGASLLATTTFVAVTGIAQAETASGQDSPQVAAMTSEASRGSVTPSENPGGYRAANTAGTQLPAATPTSTLTPQPTAVPLPTATPVPSASALATESQAQGAAPAPIPTRTSINPPVRAVPAPPPVAAVEGDGDGSFTVATYPDTQQEVFSWAGNRFVNRTKWLVSQADALDLRFVAHIGDVVNFVSDGNPQYVIAETAMDPLEAAGIPYQLSIGNHDTMATGPGGGARDSKRTREYQRTTTVFNQFWKAADYGAVAGAFEAGKVDNTYSTFSAEGASWLVLNLELWPRVAAVDWAENVIAANPHHNVMIQTHSFLTGSGDIDGAGQSVTRWQYGDSSPQYVYDRLVAPYANVKVVMSGHTGSAVSKTVTTAKGNTVAYLLQAIHSNTNNPVRLSQFNVDAGTISTRVYAPEDGATWDTNVLRGLSFIKR
ncbi:metallophosphoesterase [Planococcus sp. APC 4015]|nr:metallophosphoesterase [Planococcus sp. APC 4015]